MGISRSFGIHLTMYGITLFRLAPPVGRGESADGRVTDLGRAVPKLLRMRPGQFRRISSDPELSPGSQPAHPPSDPPRHRLLGLGQFHSDGIEKPSVPKRNCPEGPR